MSEPTYRPKITLPEPGTRPHPTKLCLFSTADIPRVERSPAVTALLSLADIPIIAVDGEAMRFDVSDHVPKGQVVILDCALPGHAEWALDATTQWAAGPELPT